LYKNVGASFFHFISNNAFDGRTALSRLDNADIPRSAVIKKINIFTTVNYVSWHYHVTRRQQLPCGTGGRTGCWPV